MNLDQGINHLQIRAFTDQDIEPCAKLYLDVFEKPPWNESRSLEDARLQIGKTAGKKYFSGFTAEYDGTPVGYLLGYRLSRPFPLRHVYYLSELFVDTGFQNKKTGKRLVGALIEDLAEKKVKWIVLLTKKNTVAEMFYQRAGFTKVIPKFSFNKWIVMVFRVRRCG